MYNKLTDTKKSIAWLIDNSVYSVRLQVRVFVETESLIKHNTLLSFSNSLV